MNRLILLFMIISTNLIILSGCKSTINSPHKTLSWNLGTEPKTLDPTLNSTLSGAYVIRETFEGLVRENDGVVEPGIATHWDITNEGKTITFHLRKSKWSDGSPLTAYDFIYAWKRGMNPHTGSEYSWIWEFTNIKGVNEYIANNASPDAIGLSAPDAYTLVLNLNKPTNYLLPLLSNAHFMPIKEESLQCKGNGSWTFCPDHAISNGPFVLDTYSLGGHILLKKNPYFWDAENVNLDYMKLYFSSEEHTSYQAYLNGELQAIPNVPSNKLAELSSEASDFYNFPVLGTYYFSFNLNHSIWNDYRIRQAISLAIDQNTITQTLVSSKTAATGFVPHGFIDAKGDDFTLSNNLSSLTYNADKARSLLAEAGYPQGKDFPAFEILYNTNDSNVLIAEMIQEMLKKNLNIDTKLTQQEWTTYLNTRSLGNYDFSKGSWYTDFLDPAGMLSIFTSNHPKNASNYSNPEFDELIMLANRTTGNEHFEYLHKAEEVLMKDLPIVPIFYYTDTWLISDNVTGWNRSSMGIIDFSRSDIVSP